MANYTSSEVQSAVEKIIRSTVRHPTGSLGERSVATSFSDLQEAASGVYILYFNAPYYTLLLGVRRLADALSTQASTIASLIDAVLATKRAVTPVNDLSNLANARSALEELEAAVTTRSSGFTDIKAVPAFRRYATNIDAFLNVQGANVKDRSSTTSSPTSASAAVSTSTEGALSIVDTPAGARKKIPGLVSQLKAQQDELVRRAGLLSAAMEDFGKLNLPKLAAQGVISRARDVLNTHYTDLSELDENTRLENLRGVVLDLLTQRPLVEKYGAGQSPSQYIPTQGLAKGFSDAIHLATPASVTSTIPGPYNILDGSYFINLTLDGGTPFDFPLPMGFIAQLNGTLSEPYALDSSSNKLTIVFDDPNATSPVTRNVTLTTGTRTAQQVVTEVNAALTGLSLVLERVFYPMRYHNPMTISGSRFTVLAGSLNGYGIAVGNEVDILEGANAGTTVTISAIDPAGLYFDVTSGGPLTPEPLPGVEVQIGPAARALRFRDTDPVTSLALRRSIRLKATGGAEDLTAALLGFFAGMEVRSQPVLAKDIADNINTSTSLFAASVWEPVDVQGAGYADVTDVTHVVMSDFLGDGTITGGTSVVFSYGPDVEMPEGPGRLVIRASSTPADVGKEGVVTSKDLEARTVNVTFSSTVTAGVISAEIGPINTFTYGDVFVINDGPNQGRYYARENQGVGTKASFEVLLDRALPVPKVGGTASKFTYSLGKSYVQFNSVLKQTSSSVKVAVTSTSLAANYFFQSGELPAVGEGSTQYLRFDTYPTAAALGDLVQLFENQYNLVSREFSITGLEPSNRVVKLSSSVESDFSMTFDQGVPNPFGAIRIAQTANYAEFKAALDSWLAKPQLTTAYYRQLARLLNPVLLNDNPTSAAVDNAANQLKSLSAILTEAGAIAYSFSSDPVPQDTLEYALDLYSSPVEPSVDALISTFRNKGADRAIDLLLEGQFSTFFGLDFNTISYSGALTQASRDVAMHDLPIRKNNRSNALGQQLIGTLSNQPDHEYDFSDADTNTPDIPGNPDVSGPGDSY